MSVHVGTRYAKEQTVRKVSFEVAYCEWVNESGLLKWAAAKKNDKKTDSRSHEKCNVHTMSVKFSVERLQ